MNGQIRLLAGALAVGICAFCWADAQATQIDWNKWTSATQGTISPDGVAVGFSIAGSGSTDNLESNYPSYTPTATFTDGTVVPNAPVSADGIIQLVGGNDNLNTLTFSSPVVNPVMAIWSLGAGGTPATFVFSNATPLFLAGGPSTEYNGSAISVNGNVVSGSEGNGIVMFQGTFASLSWTNPQAESWYGFNVGIAGVANANPTPVPEPAPWGLFALGLVGIGLAELKRRG